MNANIDADVAIVGGSLAGCAAARLLAQGGSSVVLIEKHSDPNAYKRLCGHFIQASSAPVFDRLGLSAAVEAAGAAPSAADIRTEWGWIRPRPGAGETPVRGYSIRRSKLDPMIRELAVATDGVHYMGGNVATALLEQGSSAGGVVVRDRAGKETEIRARLVVGADGRNSTVAELAGSRERRYVNNRFCYLAYYDGIEHGPDQRASLWVDGPDVLIAAPNDEGLTLVAEFLHKDRLAEFKRDREASFEALIGSIGDASAFAGARRVSKLVGYTDYAPIVRSPAPRPGVALAGDAAITCDPLLAIGCGFALQSAEWLADATAPALAGEESLERGLRRYRRVHRRRLMGHVRMLNDGALAKAPNPVQRLMFSAAVHDAWAARHLERFLQRQIRVRDFLAPSALGRAAMVNTRRALA